LSKRRAIGVCIAVSLFRAHPSSPLYHFPIRCNARHCRAHACALIADNHSLSLFLVWLQWRKKGKCRKGDRCPFGHPVKATAAAAFENDSSNQNNDSSGGANGSNSMKRRRIDGNTLVLAKKAMKRAQGQAGGGDDAITFLKE